MDIEATIKTLLEVFGIIAIVGVGLSWLLKIFTPWTKLKMQVEENSKQLSSDKKALDEIHATLKRVERRLGITSWGIIEIMNHEISGNDVHKLEKRRDDIMKDLTGKVEDDDE